MMMALFSSKQRYEIAPQSDQDNDTLSLESETEKHGVDRGFIVQRRSKLLQHLNFMALVFNILLGSVLIVQAFKSKELAKRSSILSTSFDAVTKQFNGTLWPTDTSSWSRLAPSPETDEIWELYEPLRLIPLSKADVIELGKDPATVAQFPAGWDAASGSYIGSVDVFHKIHCLNELRKMTFEGYPRDDMPKTYQHHDPLFWIHLRHCVDMLAQDLQCNAKMDITTWNWMDTQKKPMPDFNIVRTCTNWDQFIDWTVKNTLSNDMFLDLRRPSDRKPIPAEEGYYSMYGFEDSVLYPEGRGYKGRSSDLHNQ